MRRKLMRKAAGWLAPVMLGSGLAVLVQFALAALDDEQAVAALLAILVGVSAAVSVAALLMAAKAALNASRTALLMEVRELARDCDRSAREIARVSVRAVRESLNGPGARPRDCGESDRVSACCEDGGAIHWREGREGGPAEPGWALPLALPGVTWAWIPVRFCPWCSRPPSDEFGTLAVPADPGASIDAYLKMREAADGRGGPAGPEGGVGEAGRVGPGPGQPEDPR